MLVRKPLTAAGAEVRDHLKGLKVFIEWAEADRIRMLQSPQGAERVQIDSRDVRQMLWLYELLLPYAVVFGQEKQWAKELAVLYGAGNSPSLVRRDQRIQRDVVLVGHLDAVGEHLLVIIDLGRLERRRIGRRWRRRRGRGRGLTLRSLGRCRALAMSHFGRNSDVDIRPNWTSG